MWQFLTHHSRVCLLLCCWHQKLTPSSLSIEGINQKGFWLSHRTYNNVGKFGSESRPVLRELGRSCFRNHDLDSTAGPALRTQNSTARSRVGTSGPKVSMCLPEDSEPKVKACDWPREDTCLSWVPGVRRRYRDLNSRLAPAVMEDHTKAVSPKENGSPDAGIHSCLTDATGRGRVWGSGCEASPCQQQPGAKLQVMGRAAVGSEYVT